MRDTPHFSTKEQHADKRFFQPPLSLNTLSFPEIICVNRSKCRYTFAPLKITAVAVIFLFLSDYRKTDAGLYASGICFVI